MVTMDAQETLRQLGGNKFIVMTGAKNFVKGDNWIAFRIMKGKNNITLVKIFLNEMDTYDIEFAKSFKGDYKVVKRVEGVYNDQLQEIFTQETGLYTHL